MSAVRLVLNTTRYRFPGDTGSHGVLNSSKNSMTHGRSASSAATPITVELDSSSVPVQESAGGDAEDRGCMVERALHALNRVLAKCAGCDMASRVLPVGHV